MNRSKINPLLITALIIAGAVVLAWAGVQGNWLKAAVPLPSPTLGPLASPPVVDPAVRGFLRIRKDTVSGTGTFSFAITNTATNTTYGTSVTTAGSSSSGTGVVEIPLRVGTYRISEIVPTGWNLLSSSCVMASGGTATGSNSGVSGVIVSTGDTTNCTFMNGITPGTLRVIVDTRDRPDGNFSFTGNTGITSITTASQGPTWPPLSGRGTQTVSLDQGNYNITAALPLPAGWVASSRYPTGACVVSGSFTSLPASNFSIVGGQETTCHFEFDYQG